ncbi:MAG: DNA mismatch repair endonuclease MutL [Ignavibacteria bacterium]
MSNKIKILPQVLYNKIAAGEVVGRPEAVVKELVENSIDAGASEIIVIIKDAGKGLIQVIDNGSGMSEDDAVVAFQRHSTSKIETYEDLENIQTLGFRGEALASIAAISQVELKTRTSNDEVGSLVRIDGNEIIEVSKVNTDIGTSISVKNLFYNTPGRRNFLKSNQTEYRHIYETFVRQVVSNPEIEFKLFNNDELVFNLKTADLFGRLKDIFTDDFSKSLIQVNAEGAFIKVNGFISKPGFTRKSKQDQFFYLNNRFFTSKNLNFAVYSGYDDLIEKGNYPSFFLFIDIDPTKVDVNVHPSKLEVKFEDESAIFGFLRKVVKDNLRASNITFDIGFGNDKSLGKVPDTLEHKNYNLNIPDNKSFSSSPSTRGTTAIHSIFEASKKDDADFGNENVNLIPDETEVDNRKDVFEHTKKDTDEKFNVWQYQNKYIMCETDAGLMIIDQHAAHERILYEKALMRLNSNSSFSQQLLIPIKIQLTKVDYQLAKSLQDEIHNLGFALKFTVNDVVEIKGIPSDVKPGNENKIFQELIDQYKEYEVSLHLEKRDNLAKSFSCRNAVKSGERLQTQEMINLIDSLFAAELPYVCPHGRPTVIRLSTEELDKRFSRT